MKIPDEIKDKRIVMSPKMFANELSNIILQFGLVLTNLYKESGITMNEEQLKKTANDFCENYLKLIWDNNKNSKPDDPEEIQ